MLALPTAPQWLKTCRQVRSLGCLVVATTATRASARTTLQLHSFSPAHQSNHLSTHSYSKTKARVSRTTEAAQYSQTPQQHLKVTTSRSTPTEATKATSTSARHSTCRATSPPLKRWRSSAKRQPGKQSATLAIHIIVPKEQMHRRDYLVQLADAEHA